MELENREDDLPDRKREQITKNRRRSKPFNCCNTMTAIFCSSVGLSILFACYVILGAFLFHMIEAPAEVEERMRIVSMREEQISEIAKLSEKRNAGGCMTGDEQNRTRDNGSALSGLRELLRRYDRQLLVAVKYRDDDVFDPGSVRWSYFGSLLFSLSIMTTVGYGRMVPRTVLGKLASMLFGLLGIPLTILFLFKVGNTFADGFRIIYDKICCDLLCCKKCERDRKRKIAMTSDKYPAVVAGKQRRRRRRQDSVELSSDNFGFSNEDKVGETFHDQQLMIPFYCIDDVGECHTIGRRSQSSHVYESITPNEEVTSPLRGYGNVYSSRQQEGSHYSKPNKNHETRQSTLNSKPQVELKSPKSRPGDEYPRIKGIPTRDKHQPVHSKKKSKETTLLRPHSIDQKSRSPTDRSKNAQDVVSVHSKQTAESPLKDATAEKKKKKLTGYKSPTTKSRSEMRKPTVAAAGVSRRNQGTRKSPRLAKKSPRCTRAKTSSSQLGKQPPGGAAETNKHSQRILPESPSSIRRSDESFVTALDDTSSSVSSATTGSIIRPVKASNRKQKSRAEVENYKQTDNSRADYWLSMDHGSFADREDEVRTEWTNLTSDSQEDDGSKRKRKILVPISVCLLVLVVYFVSGSVLFIVWEGWDYSTSFYFCFVTLTTIGFGDLVPGRIKRDSPTTSNEKLVVCVIWMTVGLCLLTMCYILTTEKIQNIKRSKKQALKQRHQIGP